MKTSPFILFRRIYAVVFLLIALLGVIFVAITYIATTNFYEASTQLLNKDVAAHIARFTSPYGREGFDKDKADSVFYNAMVISPSAEVYFLDRAGRVIYFHGNATEIKAFQVSLTPIRSYLSSEGRRHIAGLDPRDPDHLKIFSAAPVEGPAGLMGYIYVILGSRQYRSVTQMLYSSRVTPVVLSTVLVVVAVSLLFTALYLRRIRLRFDEMVAAMGRRFREGDFMVNLSHDLRTPLAIARGYAETVLMKKGELNTEEERGYNELVVGKLRQVEKMVGQLFELAKMESRNFEPKKEPFVFSEMVGEVIRATGAVQRVEQKSLEDGSWIEADIGLMERVVQNLLVNAMTYSPAHGRICLGLRREGDELVLRMANEGAALPTDLLEWVNAGGMTRPEQPAIGLTIVKKILSIHGFLFGAEVRDGMNVFTISMPVYKAA
jgi:signal transduction histidine kinase